MTAIAVAVAFLVLALATGLLPTAGRAGTWLPLHLALAGAASSAIAGIMPFFSAAFAAAPPADTRLRWASLLSVALGATAVSFGYVRGETWLTTGGAVLFIAGVIMVGIATVRPLRMGLGPRGGLVIRGYVAALAMVGLGALLATLLVAGWEPVVERWASLKPAHAWLNLVGFVSLVIATTLLHFFPTVIGARIQRTWSAHTTIAGLASGAALVALGYALDSDIVARVGAIAVVVGAVSLVVYSTRVWRTRAAWSSDAEWHRFAMGGLVSSIAWFELGILLAAGRVLLNGADVAASSDLIAGPLVLGWMGLAVLASATHLVPAVGPGDPAAHARQRHRLGIAARARLVLANAGIAAVALGLPLGLDEVVAIGMLAIALSLGGTAILLLSAVAQGLHHRRVSRGSSS